MVSLKADPNLSDTTCVRHLTSGVDIEILNDLNFHLHSSTILPLYSPFRVTGEVGQYTSFKYFPTQTKGLAFKLPFTCY